MLSVSRTSARYANEFIRFLLAIVVSSLAFVFPLGLPAASLSAPPLFAMKEICKYFYFLNKLSIYAWHCFIFELLFFFRRLSSTILLMIPALISLMILFLGI